MDSHDAVQRLRSAALRLATEQPLDELTVAAICEEAGFSREEFFRHASHPVRLVAEALGDDLLADLEVAGETLEGPALHQARARLAIEHVTRWVTVYRGPLGHELLSLMHRTVAPAIRLMAEERVRENPELLPPGVSADDDEAIAFFSAYMAGGSIAAIESLAQGDGDIERGVTLLLAATPAFLAGT
ncbi:TetR family transcriptional regulator [Microbacterium aquimaris]|uniref:TetR family transcriptional regulator n=1 Tax=Microbacterium aquimaris TaxID=459816 RepID=UPI002AD2DC29|nr:TetR family transcriptional regulator [Microbacterium aquimaris]MDZ8275049.1 TetR family transcriptional regulator [Microbacterium aquimaris]